MLLYEYPFQSLEKNIVSPKAVEGLSLGRATSIRGPWFFETLRG